MNKKLPIVSVILILLFPLSLTAGWFYAKSLRKFYLADTAVQVNPKEIEGKNFDNNIENPECSSTVPVFLQTEFELIKSKEILYPVIEKLNLTQSMARRLGMDNLTEEQTRLLLIKTDLTVHQCRHTHIIDIEVTAPNPDEASLIANTIASQYVQYHDSKRQAAADAEVVPFKEEVAKQEKLVAELGSKVVSIPAENLDELDKGQRELAAQQQILTLLKDRYQQEFTTAQLYPAPVFVLNQAEPNSHPVKPNVALIMTVSGLVGLVPLAAGLILLVTLTVSGKKAGRNQPQSF